MTALQPVGFRSSHVIPTLACALAGIYGCVIACFSCHDVTALQPVGFRSSHVIPTRACALAGIYGCVIVFFGCPVVTALQPDAVPQHLGYRQKQRFRKEMLFFGFKSIFSS